MKPRHVFLYGIVGHRELHKFSSAACYYIWDLLIAGHLYSCFACFVVLSLIGLQHLGQKFEKGPF